jgi:hypothetical protein
MRQGKITALSIVGAACYAVWGCLHMYAGYNAFLLGDLVDPGMVRGACIKAAGICFSSE